MSRARSAGALPAGVGSLDNLKTEESFTQGDTCGDLVSINTGDVGNLAQGASLSPQSGAAFGGGLLALLGAFAAHLDTWLLYCGGWQTLDASRMTL